MSKRWKRATHYRVGAAGCSKEGTRDLPERLRFDRQDETLAGVNRRLMCDRRRTRGRRIFRSEAKQSRKRSLCVCSTVLGF
jgi:hypothetical protein